MMQEGGSIFIRPREGLFGLREWTESHPAVVVRSYYMTTITYHISLLNTAKTLPASHSHAEPV